MVKRELLKRLVLSLFQKKGLRVNKIILFGSYTKGKEDEGSDIDVIITSKDFRDKDIFERVELTRGIHRSLIKEFQRPFDIIYYSDEEWEKGHSLILNEAKAEGEIIYG